MNWFKLILCAIVVSLCIMGIIYWFDNSGTYLSKFGNGCDNPLERDNKCTYGQHLMYITPHLFLIGIIAIFVAVAWSTIDEAIKGGSP